VNILHVNQSDISGGAAIAAYRLHQGLLAQDIDSRLLVGQAKTSSDRVSTIPRKPHAERHIARLSTRLSLHYLQFVGSFDILKHDFYRSADVLNFHNLHTSTFSYLAVSTLTREKPAVFTLHDMWSFTGHCTYSYDCDRWQTGCGRCPYPESYPSVQRDNTHLEWKLKNWVYSRSNLTIITPSQWLAEQAKKSMLGHFSIHYIPNGIDMDAYQPLDSEQCRAVLGVSKNRKVLMFGADKLDDSRKGIDLLIKALQILPESLKREALLLTFGHGSETISETVGIPSLNLGYVSNDRLKAIAYSAADLFIFPTRADNLPLVLQESMACGTPMVSFKIGGVPELVRHGITGYLANPEDTQDFREGIVQLLENPALREQMSHRCREIALQEYSLNLQTERYIKLYHQILKK
jgi:glycosyltransferase involved in cell wall biosynthesis